LKSDITPEGSNPLLAPRTASYQSFLLRLWKENDSEELRASLENVTTHECHYFANMSALISFIYGQFGQTTTEVDAARLGLYNPTDDNPTAVQKPQEREV